MDTPVTTPTVTVISTPVESSRLTPVESSRLTPMESSKVEAPIQNRLETAINTPMVTLTSTPMETSISTPMVTSINTRMVTPINSPLETLISTPMDTLIRTPMETSISTPMVTSINTPMVTSINTPMVTSINTPMVTHNALCRWEKPGAYSEIENQVSDNLTLLQSSQCTVCPSSGRFSDFDEYDDRLRQSIRRILYDGGAHKAEVTSVMDFERDSLYEHSKQNEGDFHQYCNSRSLKSKCRRSVRQAIGAGIKSKITKSGLPKILQDYVLMKDMLPPSCFEDCDDIVK